MFRLMENLSSVAAVEMATPEMILRTESDLLRRAELQEVEVW
jgi:hypothetical protein